jgi:hypothetical protein
MAFMVIVNDFGTFGEEVIPAMFRLPPLPKISDVYTPPIVFAVIFLSPHVRLSEIFIPRGVSKLR